MRGRWPVIAIVVFAFVLRAAFVLLHPRPLMSDEIDYDRLGATLARTHAYTVDGHPTAYRPVGYPVVVAAVYSVFGRNPTAVKLVQCAADSLTALLLVLLLWDRNRRAALGAGLTWASFPAAILFSSQMFSETLFVFALTLFTFALDRAARVVPAIAVGLWLGAMALLKTLTLPFALVLRYTLGDTRSRTFKLVLLLCTLIPTALWVVRNARVMHHSVVTTSTGANLLVGNHAGATGGYSRVEMPQAANEVAADSAAQQLALQEILGHPAGRIALAARKVAFLLTSESELAVGHFARQAADSGVRFRDKLRSVPVWIRLAIALPSLLVLVVGAFGWATRDDDMTQRVFHALMIATVASTVVFFGGSRFRFPWMPFLTLFGVELLTDPKARLGEARGWRVAAAAAFGTICVVLWVAEWTTT